MIEARLVSSTSRRAVVRRSTSGAGVRSSNRPHSTSVATDAASSPRVGAEVQPQSLPLVTGSRRRTRPSESPRAPTTSKVPGARSGGSGTSAYVSAIASSPSPAEPRNSACQSACWATSAAAGSARPPPTPIDELIRAIAEPSFSRGSSSRMMPMPSGMAPMANPWSARPVIITTRSSVDAQISEPTTITARERSSIRRLPYRSPSRPMIGVETAPASRVAVITQVALAGSVLSRTGRSLMTGTSRVCMTATVMPAKARTGTMGPERACRGSESSPACRICFVRRIRGASGQRRSPGLPQVRAW